MGANLRTGPWTTITIAGESLAAVALATGLVAALDRIAPLAGLGVIYLLAVLLLAIRHGELAGLATAVVSVLALNFFFIEPRHQLTIADSENVVALGVFLIAALVVGRLAGSARQRAAEADERATLATAREREAAMLAGAASSVLAGADLQTQLRNMGTSIAAATGASAARVELAAVPSPADGETAMRLPTRGRPAWLYLAGDAGWGRGDLERTLEPLAGLLDVAVERERVGAQLAEVETARRADVAKTAVLHAISHDLRTPLTAISTAADALSGTRLSREDRAELVAVLEAESARLAGLVDDLLDVSRIEAGAVEPRMDWCDLHETVAAAVGQARARNGEHPVDIALRDDLPLVHADPKQLERVFFNLVDNAIRFSPDGVPVRISGGTGAGRVTIRVIDRGRGIPPSQRPHVFEPFYRGRSAGGGSAGGGSGLGLAICRGFVEANGGRIRLQAEAEGGTAFAVSFPVVPQPAPVR